MALIGKSGVGLLTALLALAACGNDSDRPVDASMLKGVLPGKSAPAPRGLSAEAARKVSTPLLDVEIERDGRRAAMALLVERGGVQTFASLDKASVTLRNGVLEQTRGLGADLISTVTDSDVLAGQADGEWDRTWQVMGPNDLVSSLKLHCTSETIGSQSLNIGGAAFAVVRRDEVCVSTKLTINNTFYTSADGIVRQSRQWAGPDAGYLVLRRPGL